MTRRSLTQRELRWAKNLKRIWLSKKNALNLTQETAAQQLGWSSQGTVGQYLNGKIPLNTDAKLKFATLLAVPVTDIDPEIGAPAYRPPMDTIGQRIRTARKAQGLTQEQLAAKCGWEYQSRLSGYERDAREPGQQELRKLAKGLGVFHAWLAAGDEAKTGSDIQNVAKIAGHRGRYFAPVISWVQAGKWDEASDIHAPGYADRWEPVPENTGPAAFWLQVCGDSMTSTHGASIPHGSLILVDPDIRPENGNLIVARLPDTNEATFKKLIIDAGRTYLMPLNPAYDKIAIAGTCQVVGVVRRAMIQF